MALPHQSIATISSPEFINLQPMDINPLMSSCEIKVLYLNENRNQTFISKQVAMEMAKTLRGAPIVGYYKEQQQDFQDHGEQIILDNEGIHFKTLTKPYGFVSPNAKVWFQDFEDIDEMGNSVVRTYLMTTGFLWTGQFQEAEKIFKDNGKPQSMELDQKSVKGNWTKNFNDNIEFFIINDAIFSKLCILGDQVEPCFQGAAITEPKISSSFTLDKDFKQSLFEMMKQLTYALEGGNDVVINENLTPEKQVDESVTETTVVTDFTENQDNEIKSSFEENNNKQVEVESVYEKKEEEEEKSEEEDSKENQTQENDEEEEDSKKKYELLQNDYNSLQEKFSALEQEVSELRQFKLEIENKEKDELIGQFYMLSDEDKKDVIENKSNYTLEEIESKLAVICYRKKVNFNLETSSENENEMKEKDIVTTYDIKYQEDSTPDWVKAVESTMNNKY